MAERRGGSAPLPESVRRTATVATVALAAVLGGFLAWQIVAVAVANKLAEAAPEQALRWRPHHARALANVAEALAVGSVDSNTIEQPEHLARAALESSPLQVTAIRVLAWMAEARGDNRRALSLMTLAGRRSQRDLASHLWLFQNRLAARDYEAAYAHGDALMRHPLTLERAARAMALSAGPDPKATQALIQRLAYGPPWRISLVEELSETQDPALVLSILLALKETAAGVAADESGVFARKLIAEGDPQQAYLAWLLLLPEGGYGDLGNVYDGGFEGLPGKGPFVWDFDRQGMAELLEAPYRDGKALSVRHTTPARSTHAWQLLVLPAGRYRFSVDSLLEDANSGGRLWWRITCVQSGVALTELEAVGERGKWRTLSASFEVPATGCVSQNLELMGQAEAPGELAWGWFDRLKIEPADVAAVEPQGGG